MCVVLHRVEHNAGKVVENNPTEAGGIWSHWVTFTLGFALGMSISCCLCPFPLICYLRIIQLLVKYGLYFAIINLPCENFALLVPTCW